MSSLQFIQNITNKQHTEISKIFFHCDNIENLQKAMKSNIYKITKKRIGNQSKEHLLNIMLYVFREYSYNLDYQLKQQLNELNLKVLEITIPMILDGIQQRYNYIKDASNLYIPMEHSKSTTIKGENPVVFNGF